jgi:hypothetical protein
MKISKPTPKGAALAGATLMLSLALVPSALAGKGSKPTSGGSSSISSPVMVVDANGDGLPNWGDTVTFKVSTTATAQPYVHLVCSGNGIAYDSWRGYFAGSLDSNWNFVLSSGGWTGGSASCTAWLGMYTKQGFKQLASTNFQVGA